MVNMVDMYPPPLLTGFVSPHTAPLYPPPSPVFAALGRPAVSHPALSDLPSAGPGPRTSVPLDGPAYRPPTHPPALPRPARLPQLLFLADTGARVRTSRVRVESGGATRPAGPFRRPAGQRHGGHAARLVFGFRDPADRGTRVQAPRAGLCPPGALRRGGGSAGSACGPVYGAPRPATDLSPPRLPRRSDAPGTAVLLL